MLRGPYRLQRSCAKSLGCRYRSDVAKSASKPPGSETDVKQELQQALSLAQRISRSSGDLEAPAPFAASSALENDIKLQKSRERPSQTAKYTKELDRMLTRDQMSPPKKLKPRNRGVQRAVKSEFCIQPSKASLEPLGPLGTNDGAALKPPRLCHELERVLFQPMNFHTLQDGRSGFYNFSKWLEDIIRVDDFDFEAVSAFVTASKDQNMLKLTELHQQRYYSSTSSMTGILSHLHFLLSNFRKTDMSLLSKNFSERAATFSWGAQLPAVVIMKRMISEKPIFSIDSDKSSDRELVLSLLGHALEAVLTTEEEHFKQTFDKTTETYKASVGKPEGAYHYSRIADFVLRSQLDAYHPNLPGTGVFDLKTRAVAAVRHDIAYVEENNNYTGYQIQQTLGKFESFERELFELIRSTMLKYSLQARIGRMDGIFIAYHNISKMFGFQYMPLEEMDYILHSYGCPKFRQVLDKRNESLKAIFGEEAFILKHDYSSLDRSIASKIADAEFKSSMSLLNRLLKLVESVLPAKFHACRLVFKTETKKVVERCGESRRVPVLNVLVAPLTEEQTIQFQKANLKKELQDPENIDNYLTKTRQLNKETTEDLIGFEITVRHEAQHHPTTIKQPRMASKKSNVLTEEAKQFVRKTANQNFYADADDWKHIQFFNPLDVQKWASNFTIRQITNREKLNRLYMCYLDDRLTALKGQTIPRKSTKTPQEIISERINRYMSEGKTDSKSSIEADEENEISQLQILLRAYSKKGELKSKLQR
ncbi:LAME_0F07712g1_1 [Lachancea meyersii CBS 8951]|uniref:LAME_0F07712g1_1 n=1 Tax=Lachancea meyersii CBS 8951 TaxID=1266667 RepID=A0A1G4JU83_9SACH|nr:LAME_0F07712g1_1 [Lachancea meyersii CBS 8951]